DLVASLAKSRGQSVVLSGDGGELRLRFGKLLFQHTRAARAVRKPAAQGSYLLLEEGHLRGRVRVFGLRRASRTLVAAIVSRHDPSPPIAACLRLQRLHA